jgi:hypothetical protein
MLFINLILTSLLWANLPPLKTKQSLTSLRFISYDGKITYYQKTNGSLLVSTNYDVKEILTLKPGTHFKLNSQGLNKRIVIEADENYFNDLNFSKHNKIYITDYNSKSAVKIGDGINAEMQNDENWVSYFDLKEKTIYVVLARSPAKKYQIKLNNPVNPYFIPQVNMINDDYILYTDLNEKGETALFLYVTVDQQFKTVFKSPTSASHLNFCYNSKKLIVGNFGHFDTDKGSQIYDIDITNILNTPKASIIYNSDLEDIGNLVCTEDNVFFIKTIKEIEELNYKTSEVVSMDLKTKSISVISNLEHVTQIINMAGRLLIPLRGEYFVLSGDETTINDDLEMKKDNKK